MDAIVQLDDVTRCYGAGDASVDAVANVSLSVQAGEFLSVMGPSGCGKSTLLNLIAGYDDPISGRVVVAGMDLGSLSERERSNLRARHLGFVVQSFDLLPRLTVDENVLVRLGPIGIRGREARTRTTAVLDKVGISPAAWKRYPAELSGGEQQRVAMARALVAERLLLLADELTGNLDSSSGGRILDLLRDLNAERGMSIVVVTHDAFAATYGHRTVTMRDGRIEHDVGRVGNGRDSSVVSIRKVAALQTERGRDSR